MIQLLALKLSDSASITVTDHGLEKRTANAKKFKDLITLQSVAEEGGAFEPYASDVAVDANGNVYVTGSVYGRADVWFYDYATIKYSTTGVALWTNLFNGVGNGGDSDNRSTVDGNGNVYVTGSATGSGSGYDFATIKYSGATIDRPLLKIQRSSGGVVLSWTNAAFSLQTESQLNGAFTNIPGATSPYTNPVTGSRQFFRLIGN